MDFPISVFPGSWLIVGDVVWLVLVVGALRRAPLHRLRDNQFSHVFFAACVALLLLWVTRVGVLPALNFHLLGVTALTLMFGWRLALMGITLVLIGTNVHQGDGYLSIGLNGLVMGGVPVVLTQSLLAWSLRRLPHNFFIYVYVNGFLAAGLSIVAAFGIGALLALAIDGKNAGWLSYQLYPFLPMLFFSEALLTGMIMTALVALRPQWVCSFDDDIYLKDK